MKIIQHLLLLTLVFICFSQVLGARKTDEEIQTESEEKQQSLFEVDDDEEDEGNSTESNPPNSSQENSQDATTTPKNKTEAPKKSKSQSRQITLPKDYNKLQIPIADTRKVYEKLLGPDFLELMDELEIDVLKDDNDDLTRLEAHIDVKVRSIRDVDELNEMDFITKWLDMAIWFENKDTGTDLNDLAKGMKSLDPIFLKKIWKPDLFIENVVSITRPELITKPIRLLFSPAGLVIFSTRVTVKMDCEMEFNYYPADTQSCTFRIRSYSYTKKELNIVWDAFENKTSPFLLDRSEHNFDIKMDKLETFDLVEAEGLIDGNYSETYSILQFKISARRKLSYHLIQTYLPSAFFIIITWLSFLVPATMVEARIGISMTTLLTLTSMFASVRESTPIVSYVKAIDLWMVACIFFVFVTLLEFTLLTWRRHLKPSEDEPSGIQISHKNEQYDAVATGEKTENIEMEDLSYKKRHETRRSTIDLYLSRFSEDEIEKYGFIAFSMLFLLFNLVYWPWLLISSDYFNWDVDLTYNNPEDN